MMRRETKINEVNACNAFIEILKKIKGVEYGIDSSPEEENRNIPDVEVILAPKDKDVQSPKIAVEHTIVEAHEEQIAYVKQSYDVVEKINFKCQGQLPTDRYFQLVVPSSLIVGTSNKSINQFVEEMICWISDVAKTLTTDQWSSRLYNDQEVTLICGGSHPEMNGTVGRFPKKPLEAEKLKRERFRRAIKDKLPKLIKYKEKGFATALLLEDISGSHALPKDDWKDLIPNQYHSEFQLKIDYVVIFVSNEKKMIVGNVWKEGSQIYAEIPYNRRFSFRR